jgi:hypothetical protein
MSFPCFRMNPYSGPKTLQGVEEGIAAGASKQALRARE